MTIQTIDASPSERRGAPRFRFSFVMPSMLGRGEAVILDISAEGARVMHFTSLARGSQVRLVFFYAGRRFAANARVLASRVVGLGNGPDGETSYQSRLQFSDAAIDAAATLTQIVQHIEIERMRRWKSNVAGEESPMQEDVVVGGAQYFMRCRLRGRAHWNKCWTRDPKQPEDGFTVPAKLGDGEVAILCEAYEKMDGDGRALIRATASEAA